MELVLPISLEAERLGFKKEEEKARQGIPMPSRKSLHPKPSCQSTFSRSHIPHRIRRGMRAPEQELQRSQEGQCFDSQFPSSHHETLAGIHCACDWARGLALFSNGDYMNAVECHGHLLLNHFFSGKMTWRVRDEGCNSPHSLKSVAL